MKNAGVKWEQTLVISEHIGSDKRSVQKVGRSVFKIVTNCF